MSDAKSLSSQARTPANRPLFLIDFVLSDPVETAFDLKQEALTTATTYSYHYHGHTTLTMRTALDRTQGAISACVHVGFVALGGAPIVLLGLLLSCSHEEAAPVARGS